MPFINTTDNRWTTLLPTVAHDFYQLPGFTEMEAELLEGEAIAWYDEENGKQQLIPLISRTIGQTQLRDLVSPYGYPGMLSNTELTTKEAEAVFERFHAEGKKEGYISSFIRLNPFQNDWNFDENTLTGPESFTLVMHGETVYIDIRPGISDIRKHFSENHKRHLKELHKAGCQLSINDWKYLPDFIKAYQQTMKRKAARDYYFFPEDYFVRLKELLGNRLLLITVSDKKGKMMAGGLFTQFDKIMQYHLGGTLDEAIALSPSKMMMEAAILNGKMSDVEVLHLGGGVSANSSDGLFRFKKGFGSHFHTFSTLRFIHRPDVYKELMKEKAVSVEDFFPGYRA